MVECQNRKSPGPDLVQGFWLKNFSSLHGKENTTSLQKNKSKGNIASNYRPKTCLPLMWKLLKGVIADQIYGHLDQQKLSSEEQKGCRKICRGTNDLLYIDTLH